jgi:uncharacterized protein (TIGR00369 family)
MRRPVEAAQASEYPPNIQAILKRPAPASAHLGQELLEIDTEEGWVKIAYRLSDVHFNRYGAIHGGVIASVMDDVVATAAGLVAAWGEIAPTLEMKVSYLNQAAAGAHTAEARVIKRGKTILFLESAMFNDAGKTIATASATIMIAPLKR